jgi:hypothetical protein
MGSFMIYADVNFLLDDSIRTVRKNMEAKLLARKLVWK